MPSDQTIILTPVKGRQFGRGVALIRRMGGTFNPASKTWTVPRAGYQARINLDDNRNLVEVVEPTTPRATGRPARHRCECASGAYGGACTCC